MNRYFRLFFLAMMSVLVAQNVSAKSSKKTFVVLSTAEKQDVSSFQLIKAGVEQAGKDAATKAMGVLGALALFSSGRHYQIVKDGGLKALFSHKDSWPVWIWRNYTSLCLTAGCIGSSYVGYKLYRSIANKNKQANPSVAVNEATQTEAIA